MAAAAPHVSQLFFLLLLLRVLRASPAAPPQPRLNLTVVNNCPFTIWPAIQPNGGYPVLERGGFTLPTLDYRSFPTPLDTWYGRVWARTGCSSDLPCATGDCGGLLECGGLGAEPPATFAQLALHPTGVSSYGVSLVDGFNLPVTVTPHQGRGPCPVVGCRADLLATCPVVLQVRSGGGAGPVVGCRSGCGAFGTDELCCRNQYSRPGMCHPSNYSDGFKRACPVTFTYAQDSAAVMHECAAPRELKLIFCPI